MRYFTAVVPAVLALLLAPATASACGSGPGMGFTYLHEKVPAVLPDDVIVAEIELATDVQPSNRRGHGARIRRMIQGDFSGTAVIVRPSFLTSCDYVSENGSSGILIGRVAGMEDGALVVNPIRARRGGEPGLFLVFDFPAQSGADAASER